MAVIDVKADIGGVVWKIEVAIGGTVAEDDPILILESMKMEIPALAPCAGTVTEYLVAEGDTVREGQVIARITT
jgi:acetyl-CoA carboxylase biotin carboxyl carrier protein